MAGQISRLIESIIQKRAKENPILADTTRVKLTLKGVNPYAYTSSSPDDPAVITRLKEIAVELGVQL